MPDSLITAFGAACVIGTLSLAAHAADGEPAFDVQCVFAARSRT